MTDPVVIAADALRRRRGMERIFASRLAAAPRFRPRTILLHNVCERAVGASLPAMEKTDDG